MLGAALRGAQIRERGEGGVRGCKMRGCRRVQGMYNTGGGGRVRLQVRGYSGAPVGAAGM